MKIRSFTGTDSTKLRDLVSRDRALSLLAALLLAPGAAAVFAQGPVTVTLAPNSCPAVHDGDTVSFSFIPRFDNPTPVQGLRNLELKFEHGGRPDPVDSAGAQFTLRIVPRGGEQQAREGPMAAASGGPGEFRFRANLRSVQRGMFYLVAISADPLLAPGYEGDTPRIVNAVAREHLCLQVAPPD